MNKTTAPVPNAGLLDATLTAIRENKTRWYQGYWRTTMKRIGRGAKVTSPTCGTAMCFAGWAVQLDKGRYLVPDSKAATYPGPAYHLELLRPRKAEIKNGDAFYDSEVGAQVITVRRRARNVLGLTRDEGQWLFHERNSLTTLRRVVRDIKNGKTREPNYIPPQEA